MNQSAIVRKIIKFFKSNRRMPSYGEMLSITGFKSKNAVSKLIDRLSVTGILSKDSTGRVIPGKNLLGIRVLGAVEAGFPSPAEEELSDTMSMDDYLIHNKEATFMLKVQGDSMIDAGIMPGDMVLVERGLQARDGDIVIAEIDNGWTMKYLKKKGNQVYLVPANKKYPTFMPQQELNIAAVVKAVVRKY